MTTRTYLAEQTGAITVDVDLLAGQINVTAEDRTDTLITITTPHDSGAAAATLAAAQITETPGRITVRLPKPPGGGVTSTTQVRRGGVTVIQTGGTVYGTVVGAVFGNVSGGDINVSGGDMVVTNGTVSIGVPITIDVRVPLGSSLAVKTTSADLDTSGELQRADVVTVSGDIRLDAVGSPDLRSTSGDIRITRLTGTHARAKTVSGDVRVHAAQPGATVSARSVSGDIRITGNNVDLDARTVSGRVTTR